MEIPADKVEVRNYSSYQPAHPALKFLEHGLLTITNEQPSEVLQLRIPNKEVRDTDWNTFFKRQPEFPQLQRLQAAFDKCDFETIARVLSGLTAKVANDAFKQNAELLQTESFWLALLQSYLIGAQLDHIAEPNSLKGRADFAVRTYNNIFVIEVETKSAKTGKEQMQKNEYYKAYLGQRQTVYAVVLVVNKTGLLSLHSNRIETDKYVKLAIIAA